MGFLWGKVGWRRQMNQVLAERCRGKFVLLEQNAGNGVRGGNEEVRGRSEGEGGGTFNAFR